MFPHHEASIRKMEELFRSQPDVIALILGGSVARGTARSTSDIDAMAILDGDSLEDRHRPRPRSESIQGLCTYPDGYFDIKYYTKGFLESAADHGSEPTRNAFVGARVLFSSDPDVERLVQRIPVYPEDLRREKIHSFLGGLALNAFYFWEEAEREGDPYLMARSSSDIALYGLRLLLAHNRSLFPSHKRLLAAVASAPEKPEGIVEACRTMLREPTREHKDAFVLPILGFTEWGFDLRTDFGLALTRFIDDNELWWHLGRPNVAEW